jgi:hypothetical protein
MGTSLRLSLPAAALLALFVVLQSATAPLRAQGGKVLAPPPEEKCRQWGALLERLVKRGDLSACNELIDRDTLLKKATAYPNPSKALIRQRAAFIVGAKERSASRDGFIGQILDIVQHGGTYKFLRCRNVDGRRCAQFRLIMPQGGINYHHFELASSADGTVRAVDWYLLSTGEWQTASLRHVFLPLTQSWLMGGSDQLTPAERDLVASFMTISDMPDWIRAKQYRRVLDAYQRLPDSVKRVKSVLLRRMDAAHAVDQAEYLRTIEDYRKYYPNDASIDLTVLDAQMVRGSFDLALATIDRIDKAMGGDPYLKVLRVDLLEKQGKSNAAWKIAEAAVAEEPTLLPAYFSLLELALHRKNFAKIAELLTAMESKLGVKFKDLTTFPAFAEFVKSDEYKAWRKSGHGGP